MRRFKKITILEWKLLTREFITIFFALIFPVMMLLLFGSIYGNEPNEFMNGYGTVDVSTPGYINMIVAVTGLMSLPLTLAQYRERKILKRFMASPIHPMDILLSQIIVNVMLTLIGLIMLIIVGIIVFDLKFYGNFFEALLAFIIIMLSIFSIGLFITAISKNTRMANAISYIIYFPMLFLSGATMPLELMPQTIRIISKALPMTYGVELFKGVWLGDHLIDFSLELLLLGGITLLFGGLSIKLFKWV